MATAALVPLHLSEVQPSKANAAPTDTCEAGDEHGDHWTATAGNPRLHTNAVRLCFTCAFQITLDYIYSWPLNNTGGYECQLSVKSKNLSIIYISPRHMQIPNHQLALEWQGFKLSRSIGKTLGISGPMRFKPMLFKGWLYLEDVRSCEDIR